jgi:tRNA threonylcarbamoyladenosine biosynthesis protein TsaB
MSAMLILAFDTTNERGGAGIFRDAECLAIAENGGGSNYSVSIFQMVDWLLAETGLEHSGFDVFAVANGPGSFTGIRVGVAAAQGWARTFGRPVCGVSVLGALTVQAEPETEWAAPVLDARRGEFYASLFRRVPGSRNHAPSYVAQGDAWILKPHELAENMAQKIPAQAALTCLVREHDHPARKLAENLPSAIRCRVVPGLLVPAIARMALVAYTEGRLQSPAEIDACYIRRTDAELHWQE